MKLHRHHVSRIAGLGGVAIYAGLALIAFGMFAAPFGPSTNWLSDLGHRLMNPRGALFYRLAGILGGAALFAFFLSLPPFTTATRKDVRVLNVLARVFGAIASLCFIMTGVFSEDMMPMHSWFSIANFMSFGTAIAITAIIGIITRGLPVWFTVLCLAAWVFDLASWALGDTRWLEWVVVAFLIAYVVSLSLMRRIPDR